MSEQLQSQSFNQDKAKTQLESHEYDNNKNEPNEENVSSSSFSKTSFTTMGMFIIDEIHFENLEPTVNKNSETNTNKFSKSKRDSSSGGKRPPVYDIIGGGGTYAVLGCRFFFPNRKHIRKLSSSSLSSISSVKTDDGNTITAADYDSVLPPASDEIGWIIDVGNDFPEAIRQEVLSWNTNVIWRDTPHRKTTRGWNFYGKNEFRGKFVFLLILVLYFLY